MATAGETDGSRSRSQTDDNSAAVCRRSLENGNIIERWIYPPSNDYRKTASGFQKSEERQLEIKTSDSLEKMHIKVEFKWTEPNVSEPGLIKIKQELMDEDEDVNAPFATSMPHVAPPEEEVRGEEKLGFPSLEELDKRIRSVLLLLRKTEGPLTNVKVDNNVYITDPEPEPRQLQVKVFCKQPKYQEHPLSSKYQEHPLSSKYQVSFSEHESDDDFTTGSRAFPRALSYSRKSKRFKAKKSALVKKASQRKKGLVCNVCFKKYVYPARYSAHMSKKHGVIVEDTEDPTDNGYNDMIDMEEDCHIGTPNLAEGMFELRLD